MKLNKAERINNFLLREAPDRALAYARKWLSSNDMHLTGCDDFDAAMGAIIVAMVRAYERGLSDSLDTVNGTKLEVL